MIYWLRKRHCYPWRKVTLEILSLWLWIYFALSREHVRTNRAPIVLDIPQVGRWCFPVIPKYYVLWKSFRSVIWEKPGQQATYTTQSEVYVFKTGYGFQKANIHVLINPHRVRLVQVFKFHFHSAIVIMLVRRSIFPFNMSNYSGSNLIIFTCFFTLLFMNEILKASIQYR